MDKVLPDEKITQLECNDLGDSPYVRDESEQVLLYNTDHEKLNVDDMFGFIMNLKVFKCCNDVLYLHQPNGNYYKPLKPNEERVSIVRFISPLVRRILRSYHVDEIIKRLKSVPELQIEPHEFNKNKNLINTKSGVLGRSSEDLVDKENEIFNYVLPVERKMDITIDNCPSFKQFCKTSLEGNLDKIKQLLQMIAYVLSNLNGAKAAFFLIGPPHCGKSILLTLLECLAGKENVSNISLHQFTNKFALAKLSTSRINISSEIGGAKISNLHSFKVITGNDSLEAEYKGKDLFSFRSSAKLIFAGNIMPTISEGEINAAFFDRLVVLKFSKSIPKSEWDLELQSKLMAEKNEIFSLAIETLDELIESNFQFVKPVDSEEFIKGYRNEHETVELFLEDCCSIDPDKRIHKSALYSAYVKYCNDNCFASCFDSTLFCRKLESLVELKKDRYRCGGSNPLAGYIGIGLKL